MLMRKYHIISHKMFLDVVFNEGFQDSTNRRGQTNKTTIIANIRAISLLMYTGVIRASFQCLGSTEHSKDLLYRKDKGLLSSCAHSFKQNSGQPSGPGALLGFSWVSLSNTIAGVIVMSVSEEWQPSNWYWGRGGSRGGGFGG